MAIPNKATGAGNGSAAQNVFRITFSEALSAAPRYEAYDGGAFPAVGAAVTAANSIFAGTAGNGNRPMLYLVDTSSVAPAASWKPANATAGSANPNRLLGATNYVTSPVTPAAGGTIRFNIGAEIPSDLEPATATMAHDLLVRYSYTGAAPTLTWSFNDGGTEAAPVWTALTPGTHGLRYTRSGTVAGGPYRANIPASGTEDIAEVWVTV